MSRPRVIFFDAVGTLFGVQGSVGAVYGELARPFGVDVNPELLNLAFFQTFRAATPMAFPGVSADDIAEREYAWWWAIAAETFQSAGVLNRFTDFSTFFNRLYDHFATADPWIVYPDTLTTLTHWQNQGVELGILSNFDSRIHRVLTALELSPFFTSVTISTEVGAAKPNPKVFAAALAKHSCSPSDAWHIGDSLQEDYEGAKAAGLRGILLQR